VGGALPAGLTLDVTTGNVGGIPTSEGTAIFTIRASNSAGQTNLVTSIAVAMPIIAVISLSTNDLNFGNQNVGTTSAARIVTVTNTGNGPFDIRNVDGVGDFGFTSTCSGTLVPNASCTVTVTFTPLTAATLSGRISVNSTALQGDGGIGLAGAGVAVPRANMITNPTSVSFGNQAQGTMSAAQIIFISNTGLATLQLRSIGINSTGGIPTSFIQGNPPPADNPNSLPTCGGSLAPGTSCAIGISFAPATGPTGSTVGVGAQSANLVITHNSTPTGEDATSSISLNGNATVRREAIIRLNTTSANFVDQVIGTISAAQTVTVTNAGTIDLNVTGLSVNATNANTSEAEFVASNAISTNSCASLIPNANCTISITFAPSNNIAAIGAKAATLNIASNASNAANANSAGSTGSGGITSLSMTGNAIAVPAPVVRLSATTVGFGSAIIGGATTTQRITLTNIGGLPLRLSGINIGTGMVGDYSQANNCPITPAASLATNQSCAIDITYDPTGLGARNAGLVITSNATPNTNTVPLVATGCRFLSSAQQRLFVTNCGGQ